MALKHDSEIRDVKGLTDHEIEKIMDFIQGAVYCWCKNRKNEWFSMRDLMVGDNYYWEGTPLQVLYDKHRLKGKDHDSSVKDAGNDSGWLLKSVLSDDRRTFDSGNESLIQNYKWIDGI